MSSFEYDLRFLHTHTDNTKFTRAHLILLRLGMSTGKIVQVGRINAIGASFDQHDMIVRRDQQTSHAERMGQALIREMFPNVFRQALLLRADERLVVRQAEIEHEMRRAIRSRTRADRMQTKLGLVVQHSAGLDIA